MPKVTADRRTALSTVVAAVAILVIIIVAAGAVLLLAEHSNAVTSSTSTSSAAQVSSSSMTSADSSYLTSTSSASSSSTTDVTTSSFSATSSSSSTSHYSGRLFVSFDLPYTPFVASDVNVTYPISVTGLGKLPNYLSLKSNDTDGITMTFSPSNISLTMPAPITVAISVANSVVPGLHTYDFEATGGGDSLAQTLQVQVVWFLVAFKHTFAPANLTVPVGSTITWVNLNGRIGLYYSGYQNVVFSNNMTTSPVLTQYQTWNLTFYQIGSFQFESTYSGAKGEITVVAD
jgi:plastocyanin